MQIDPDATKFEKAIIYATFELLYWCGRFYYGTKALLLRILYWFKFYRARKEVHDKYLKNRRF